MRFSLLFVFLGCFAIFSASAEAGSRSRWSSAEGAYPKAKYYRGAARVKGYVRRGGYSYTYRDVLNSYGTASTIYGGANRLREPANVRQQSSFGPFDSGFFFVSPTSPYGGDAPYMH